MNPADLPEALAASALTMLFCSQPDQWAVFEEWLRDNQYLRGGERLASRDHMTAYSQILATLTQEVQAEIIALQFEKYLEDVRDGTG